jgi:O6-methylguanine-DNA--protein-cysteine methyltransferase
MSQFTCLLGEHAGMGGDSGDLLYDNSLRRAARRARRRPSSSLPSSLAAAALDTPVGRMTVAATPAGLVRVVFDSHADAPALREVIRSRRGGRAARAHVDSGVEAVRAFFDGREPPPVEIDWSEVDHADILRATRELPPGETRSYDRLDVAAEAPEIGRALGANPLAIVVPCHQVTQAARIPEEYVGGADTRLLLRRYERV